MNVKGDGRRPGRTGANRALSAGLGLISALLLAALAVSTNVATSLVPAGWEWAHSASVMWTAVGVLAALTAALAGARITWWVRAESPPTWKPPPTRLPPARPPQPFSTTSAST